MKIGIVGVEVTEKDYDRILKDLPKSSKVIISGGPTKLDQLAVELKEKFGLKHFNLHSYYKKYGKSADAIKEKILVELSDLIIIVPGSNPDDIKEIIKYAKKTNTDFYVIPK